MNTISLISWLCNEECYVEFFVMYHLEMGFDAIYLIVDYKDNIENYKFLKKYSKVHLIENMYKDVNWDNNNNNMSTDIIKYINTEWTMLISIDQFFFNKEFNIKLLLNSINNDIIQFQFPMFMIINYLNKPFSLKYLPEYTYYCNSYLNACCRTKYIKRVSNHFFFIEDGLKIMKANNIELFDSNTKKDLSRLEYEASIDYFLNNPFSLHFYCRNYYDLIIKLNDFPFDNLEERLVTRLYAGSKIKPNIYEMILSSINNKNVNIVNYIHDDNKIKKFVLKNMSEEKMIEYLNIVEKLVKKYTIENLPGDFNWLTYLNTYPDLRKANIIDENSAITHYLRHGRFEGRIYNGNLPNDFNWKTYVNTYPDLRQSKILDEKSAITHYLKHGIPEGRIYNGNLPKDFDWISYINMYPDLKQINMNENDAITHYLKYGMKEGRLYKPELPHDFDWLVYINNNPDLIQANILNEDDAIKHYLRYGIFEGRIYKSNI